MHDATKVLMGTTQSSDRTVDSKVGSLPAGTIVRLKSDGTLSKAAADGEALGISLGKDLSDTDKIAIVRRGLKVPLLLTDSFEPTVGAQVTIDDVTGIGKAAGSGVTGVNATFASGVLTGIAEDGIEVDVALIDMPGGL
jgi:hypothetical protein